FPLPAIVNVSCNPGLSGDLARRAARAQGREWKMSKIELPKSVMAAINFKGGTGKTTVALAIAEGICRLMRKRVAVIDCDFQCSASIALLGRRTLNDLILKNATMDALLHNRLAKKNGARLADSVFAAQFCVSEAVGLMHIVPGSPNMPRREREMVGS